MSRNGPATNLLMALWYKRADFVQEGRKTAKKVLDAKKTPAINRALIRYLLALLDEDSAEAGIQLDQYCRGVSHVKEFGIEKLHKMFWPCAHGLYNLAFAVWKRKAHDIMLPEPDCFCRDQAAPGRLRMTFIPASRS
ncbi:MAG: hypothetical protein LBU11_07795 [Zoogloeaceae bacterium]|nr:hypothetical protein [Zoogloeaceae bacterium]